MSSFTDKTGKLQPLWAAMFSLLLSALAFFVSNNIAHEAAEGRPFRIELIFRALWTLLLFGIFIWLLTIGDHVEEHRIAAQGLPRTSGWLRHFVIGCLLGLLLPALTAAPIYFWGHFRSHSLMTLHLLPNLAAVVLTLLFGALAEELVFRGYPFQRLEQGIGVVPAVIVFSVLYGLLHLLNPHPGLWGIGNSMLIGVLLSVAYLRTRALWLPWGIHFGWNIALGPLMGLPISGFRSFGVMRYTQAYGPAWMTDSSYGIEASAVAAGVILLGILLIAVLPFGKLPQPLRRHPEPALQDAVSSIKP